MKRRQFRTLYRQFLFRMVDLELLAPQGDITKLLGQLAALLMVVSLWVLAPSIGLAAAPAPPEMELMLAWVEAHFLVSTTMLVVGLFAVLSWESMFPDRRDVLVLSPLPVPGRTMFLAKVAAVATALSLTVAALNIFPGLFGPFVFATAPAAGPPVYDAAMPPLSAGNLQSVLERDLIPARSGSGALAQGTHAGVAAGVLKHGERRVFAYGGASRDSIFEIGSIAKTFTGLILARMVEQGKVRFDQPVRELLPPGTVPKPVGGEITLLDLAMQHSGLPRMPGNFKPASMTNPYVDYGAANLYDYVSRHGVARPANAGFLYSNLGFGLLGQALANRAGVSYPALLAREVTGPLGMSDTMVTLSAEQQNRFIQGYNSSHRPVREWDFAALAGAGAIRSTAGDMLTYLEAQMHPEKAPALASALTQSHQLHAEGFPGSRIALAWYYRLESNDYWHNGGTAGYTSYASFDPKGDSAVVVLMNTSNGFAGRLGEHIRQRLAGLPAISLKTAIDSGKGGALNTVRSFAAYWVSMLAAGMFVFGVVLSVQGLAQLLPRQWFLRGSAILQTAFFCLLLTAYFFQPGFTSLETLSEKQELVFWLPSYWFFGLFEQLNGPMPPLLGALARRAWLGLAWSLGGAALAYLICYFRTLRKIAEQPDILPAAGGLHWLPRFGNAFTTAIVQFSIRTLLRSRQHRMILSFYLGLAFGLAIFFAKSPEIQEQFSGLDPWRRVNAPMLVASIVMMGAAVMGARVVFSMPLDLRANWIFRVMPIPGAPDCLKASRRGLLVLSVFPVWAISAVVFLWLWPWRPALGHVAALGLLGMIVAEASLRNFRKLPFTCSYLPGRSYAHMMFLGLIGVLVLVVKGADLERRALDKHHRSGFDAGALCECGGLGQMANRGHGKIAGGIAPI